MLGEGTVLYSVKKLFGIDDFHKLLLNDVEMTMKAFQPVWQLLSMEADGINGEKLITHMSLIVEGMTTTGLWYESKAGIHKPFASVSLYDIYYLILKIAMTNFADIFFVNFLVRRVCKYQRGNQNP
jgi:hypothetical protein